LGVPEGGWQDRGSPDSPDNKNVSFTHFRNSFSIFTINVYIVIWEQLAAASLPIVIFRLEAIFLIEAIFLTEKST
jgi:hypothetical protein